jgi:hypothetical protein
VLEYTIEVFASISGNSPVINISSEVINQLGDDNAIAIIVHNSLAWKRLDIVEILVNRSDVVVKNGTGQIITSQVHKLIDKLNERL